MQPILLENGTPLVCQEVGEANRGALTALYEFGLWCFKRRLFLPPNLVLKLPGRFLMVLNEQGELVKIEDIRTTEEIPAKKKGALPKIIKKKTDIRIPYAQKHSNGVSPHLGADNAEYLCGVSEKVKKGDSKTRERFDACGVKHEEVLSGVDSPLARGIIAYFKTWDPTKFKEHPAWLALDDEQKKSFMTSTYLTFKSAETGLMVMEDPAVEKACIDHFEAELKGEEETVLCTCAITGEKNVPRAEIHVAVPGVLDAQSSGAYYQSYGGDSAHSTVNYMTNQRGANYPIGKMTSMIIGEALKYLLSDRRHYRLAPDNTYYVFWTAGEAPENFDVATAASMAIWGPQSYIYSTTEDEYVAHAVGSMLAANESAADFEGLTQSSDVKFYLLVLHGNAARIVERSFQCMSFGSLMENVRRHSGATKIIDSRQDKAGTIRRFAFTELLRGLGTRAEADGTVKSPRTTALYNTMLSAVTNGGKYPDMVGRLLLERICFDHWLSSERMALLRGYLCLNSKDEKAREAASTPWLNDNADCPAYILGRIFYMMLNIQRKAVNNPKSNYETIYLSSMINRPQAIFPKLLVDAKSLIRGLKTDTSTRGLGYRYEWDMAELLNRLPYPFDFSCMASLDQKLAFCLGYMMARHYSLLPKAVKEELDSKQEKRDWPVALDDSENDPAYLAGRLFYICESMQRAAMPDVLNTIDRQYLSAMASRAEVVTPAVLDKAQAYVQKMTKKSSDKKALGYWYLGLVNQMAARLPRDGEGNLALPRGVTGTMAGKMNFMLGYFHEEHSWRKSRLEKREAEEKEAADAEDATGLAEGEDYGEEDY